MSFFRGMKPTKIGDIGQVVSGSTPKTGVGEYWDNGNIVWLTPTDLRAEEKYLSEGGRKITEAGLESANLTLVPKGTVLLTSRAPIGKVAIAGTELCTNQGFKNIICSDKVHNEYLYYYLKGNTALLNHLGRGATFKEISKTIVEDIEIPLPPLETQKKIAAVLARAQELIDKRKQQIEMLDEFLQSVFLDMFGDPVTNPDGLPTISLGEIGKWQSGGTPSRAKPEFFQGNIPWLTAGELNHLYVYDSIESITQKAIQETSARFIEKGSLLLGMYDTAALKSSINMMNCSCNQAIAFSKLDESRANTLYVYHIIQYGKDHYKRQQRGVRQKNLNLSMIRNLEILYPPISEQNRFAGVVDQVIIRKRLMEKALSEMQNLFNSIMQRAFKGERFN